MDPVYKYVLLGDSNVGKTSIARRFLSDYFSAASDSTIGVEFNTKSIDSFDLNGKPVRALIHLWDTCGQERYRSIVKIYYRNAKCIFLVFDVTNRASFLHISSWLDNLKYCFETPLLYLIGNKSDMHQFSTVTFAEAESFAISHHMKYYELSAKTGDGIVTVFSDSIHSLIASNIPPSILPVQPSTATPNGCYC